MAPVIISKDMIASLPYGITVDSSNISTLHIKGLGKQASQIHIFQKMKTAALISLGVLCGYGCSITLDK